MSLRPAALIVAVCLALAAAPAALHAGGVVGNGAPGSCTEAALNAALVGGGTVTFNCGVNPVVITFTSQKLLLQNTSTIIDGGNADRIIFDGGGTTRHFLGRGNLANPTSLTLRNLTLRNGRCPLTPAPPDEPDPGYGASIRSSIGGPLTVEDSKFINNVCEKVPGTAGNDQGGGAIRQRRGPLTIRRSTFSGNRASNGGAISASDAIVLIEDSTFTGNTTNAHTPDPNVDINFNGVGGAFYNDESADNLITIRRSRFTSNTATFAAGALQAFFVPGDQGLVLEDCTFEGNSAPGDAGAALIQRRAGSPASAAFTSSRNTFSGNTGVNGGAMYLNTISSTITNTTISGNTATNIGGAIYAGASNVTFTHATIASNQANTVGGAVAMDPQVTGSVRGTIFASNTSPSGQCGQPSFTNAGGNIQFPSGGPCAPGALASDPLLAALANNGGFTQTRAIPGGSPAINLVTGCPPPATDQRGVSRPQAGACDAGAYEANILISIGDVSLTEGNAGTVGATFTATLSAPSSQTVTVAFATAPGTATAGADFVAATGTVTFSPSDVSEPVTIQIVGDTLDENDEALFVNLSNPSGASVADGQGTGTILDDDPPPSITVGPCAASEGGPGGSTPCTFLAVLSAASGKTVSVSYATANGNAAAGSDYQATAGTLTIAPGAVSGGVIVPILGDSADEIDETFTMNLSSPTNATISGGQGVGTIDDDDGPSVSVNSVAVNEGNAGTTPATFTLSLSATSPQTVAVSYATSDGTADSGADYAAASNQATFAPGALTQNVTVNVNGDGTTEPNEAFFLNLQNPVDGSVGVASGVGTIRNDDGTTPVVRELGHGAGVRDGFTATADIFSVALPARTSWEVIVDESSGDAGGASGPAVQQVDNDRTTVLQNSTAAGFGAARSLRLQNTSASGTANYVRVASSQCSADCGPDDRYRIRAYETTLRTPRFNNAGSQFTVVVLQNTVTATVAGTIYFWGPSGAFLGSQSFSLPGRGLLSLNTATVPGVAGQGGAITIVHDGRYADLSGKAVSLDPAAGFSFDSTLAPPPR